MKSIKSPLFLRRFLTDLAPPQQVASSDGEWACPTCCRPQLLNPEVYTATSFGQIMKRSNSSVSITSLESLNTAAQSADAQAEGKASAPEEQLQKTNDKEAVLPEPEPEPEPDTADEAGGGKYTNNDVFACGFWSNC